VSTGSGEHQRRLLAAALAASGLTRGELWLKYFSIGGSVGEYEAEAYLAGLLPLPAVQRDLLAHAANELIDDLPERRRAPYSTDPVPGPEVSPPQPGDRKTPGGNAPGGAGHS
jgi:hypothetical protein